MRLLYLVSILLLFSGICPFPSMSQEETWQASGFEDSPADVDAASTLGDKVRDTRAETRKRAEVEHHWGDQDTDQDDNGLHRHGSARAFYQSAAPTVLHQGQTDYNPGGAGEGTLDNVASGSDGAEDQDDVGDGRIWVDSDDNKIYIYDGVAGDGGGGTWDEVVAQHDTVGDFVAPGSAGLRVKAGARNLLTNNDFDFDSCTGTSDPTEWTSTNATIAYATTDPTEGNGCEVIVTATAIDGEIEQVLTNLQASTTYRVVARAHSDGVDTCRINTTGADTDLSNQDTTSATYVTLEGTFVTTAALNTVTVNLISVNNTDACSWDHVGVYAQEATELPESGIVPFFVTLVEQDIIPGTTCNGAGDPIDCCTGAGAGATCDLAATGGSFTDVPELSVTWTPPTEGWMIAVNYSVSIGCDAVQACGLGSDEGAICRLEKGGTAVAGTESAFTTTSAASTFNETLQASFLDPNPAPGTPITYTVGCIEHTNANGLFFNRTNDSESQNMNSYLSVIAYPPH